MNRTNAYIRQYAKEKHVYLWELAKEFNVTDSYFSKCLRNEFPEEKKNLAIQFIDKIAAHRQEEP